MIFAKRKRRISRLLVVEDEVLVAFDTEHFLGDEGFEIVATVDSVAHAVALIDGGSEIDLVLADLKLADGSGAEVAATAHAAGIPVIFVSGSSPGEAEAVATGWLSKPYQQRDLLLAIDAVDAVLEGVEPKRIPTGFVLYRRAAA